jgi:hypothetical protein
MMVVGRNELTVGVVRDSIVKQTYYNQKVGRALKNMTSDI